MATRYLPEWLVDPDKIQKDLVSQCASMLNVAIRPEMAVEMVVPRLAPGSPPAQLLMEPCRG